MKTAHACELRDSYNIISWHNSMTKQQLASSEQLIDKHTSLFLDRMKGCVYQTVEEQVNMSRVLINELFRRRQLLHGLVSYTCSSKASSSQTAGGRTAPTV